MEYDVAPMEGITGWLYRKTHHAYFPGVDRYYMPFLSPGQGGVLTRRDKKELAAEHNAGLTAVPQLLTRRAPDFIQAARELADLGFREVNLNLGCPSGTVVAKGKGAGFLAYPQELEAFLTEIFAANLPLDISVKSRLGMKTAEEFDQILELFHQFPLSRLILHPRVRQDFYKAPVNRPAFARALARCRIPLCYNGDLFTPEACRTFAQEFPSVPAVMLGRGLVGDPALIGKLQGEPLEREHLHRFLLELYEGYCREFDSRRNAMLRMKEIWFYLIYLFDGGAPYGKKLKKATHSQVYEALVEEIFDTLPLNPALPDAPVW